MQKQEKKEKPVPVRCKCGAVACSSKVKGRGWLCSCSNPEKCFGNFRTEMHRSEDAAITAWNNGNLVK